MSNCKDIGHRGEDKQRKCFFPSNESFPFRKSSDSLIILKKIVWYRNPWKSKKINETQRKILFFKVCGKDLRKRIDSKFWRGANCLNIHCSKWNNCETYMINFMSIESSGRKFEKKFQLFVPRSRLSDDTLKKILKVVSDSRVQFISRHIEANFLENVGNFGRLLFRLPNNTIVVFHHTLFLSPTNNFYYK